MKQAPHLLRKMGRIYMYWQIWSASACMEQGVGNRAWIPALCALAIMSSVMIFVRAMRTGGQKLICPSKSNPFGGSVRSRNRISGWRDCICAKASTRLQQMYTWHLSASRFFSPAAIAVEDSMISSFFKYITHPFLYHKDNTGLQLITIERKRHFSTKSDLPSPHRLPPTSTRCNKKEHHPAGWCSFSQTSKIKPPTS